MKSKRRRSSRVVLVVEVVDELRFGRLAEVGQLVFVGQRG